MIHDEFRITRESRDPRYFNAHIGDRKNLGRRNDRLIRNLNKCTVRVREEIAAV